MPNVHTVKEGETYYIDGEIPCKVHGVYKYWVVVIPDPPVSGTYSQIPWESLEIDKKATVTMLIVHPENLRSKRKDPNAPSC